MHQPSDEMRRIMVAAFIKQQELPTEFTRWPLHITILPPWFEVDSRQVENAMAALEKVARIHLPFTVYGEQEALFGSRHTVRVRRVGPEPFTNIHRELFGVFRQLEGSITNFKHSWVLNDYTPHATDQENEQLDEGEAVVINSVSLIERMPDQLNQKYNKKVIYNATS